MTYTIKTILFLSVIFIFQAHAKKRVCYVKMPDGQIVKYKHDQEIKALGKTCDEYVKGLEDLEKYKQSPKSEECAVDFTKFNPNEPINCKKNVKVFSIDGIGEFIVDKEGALRSFMTIDQKLLGLTCPDKNTSRGKPLPQKLFKEIKEYFETSGKFSDKEKSGIKKFRQSNVGSILLDKSRFEAFQEALSKAQESDDEEFDNALFSELKTSLRSANKSRKSKRLQRKKQRRALAGKIPEFKDYNSIVCIYSDNGKLIDGLTISSKTKKTLRKEKREKRKAAKSLKQD